MDTDSNLISTPESDGARPESDLEKKRKEIPESESDLEKKRRKNDDLEAESQSESCSLIITINEDSLFNDYYVPNFLITDRERGFLEEMTKQGSCNMLETESWKEWHILFNMWNPATERDCIRDMKTEYPELKDYDTAGIWFPYLARDQLRNPRYECCVDHVYIFHTYS
jgi:hypothetical protein